VGLISALVALFDIRAVVALLGWDSGAGAPDPVASTSAPAVSGAKRSR
jgi:hypothetical protein